MLARYLRRSFAGSIYTWGPGIESLMGPTEACTKRSWGPKRLALNDDFKVNKAFAGVGRSLVLTKDGKAYFSADDNSQTDPAIFFEKLDHPSLVKDIVDADLGSDNAVLLSKNGEVYQASDAQNIEKINLHMKPKFIGAGKSGGAAIAEDEKLGHTHVFAWGVPSGSPNPFLGNVLPKSLTEPIELKKLSKLINSKNSKVRKFRVADQAGVILLENGELVSWGNNLTGNLAVPRSELSFIHHEIAEPAEPLQLNDLKIKVADFELSDNLLIVLSTDGKAYFSGLDNVLRLKEVQFFSGQKIKKVGAIHNQFFVQAEDGTWYSNVAFEGQELVKFYGDLNLVQVEQSLFGADAISEIAGKFANAFAR